MTDMPQSPSSLTLANCADEPIHLPGTIQPHGALFAFDGARTLVAWSANAAAMLGVAPVLGARADALGLPDCTLELIEEIAADMEGGEARP